MREDRDTLVDKLHKQVTESTAVKLENERLKVSRGERMQELDEWQKHQLLLIFLPDDLSLVYFF